MTNIEIYKSRISHFCALVLIVFVIISFAIFDLEKSRPMSRSTTFNMASFDGNYQNLSKQYDFCALGVSEIFTFEIFDLEK